MSRSLRVLLDYYDLQLGQYGDTAQGAAWPNERDRRVRFDVGLEIISRASGAEPITVCDLGCGTGEFYRHILEKQLGHISYVGVDGSRAAIGMAREKFPSVPFHCVEASEFGEDPTIFSCDFVMANGLFTVKRDLTHAQMWRLMARTIEAVWPRVRRGVVFNVMSKTVDSERDDLFHVSYDDLARFLVGLAGQSIGFRSDYGLYEVMAYAIKPKAVSAPIPVAGVSDVGCGLAAATVIPVCRPLLPTTKRLLPYLSVVDRARRYSNHGELTTRLTQGLAGALGCAPDAVCLASSGTAGLIGAILARAGRATTERPIALCPAFTFVATVLAVEAAGYEPRLVDVDERSWALEPATVSSHPQIGRAGLIMVTAPYGHAFSQKAWSAFSRESGIPVVIDAAASFENVCGDPQEHIGETPVVLSLHATKAFSCAEGGAVISTDQGFQPRVVATLNFGFAGTRDCALPGINGKLSEYHAAVGLAELSGWEAKRADYKRAADLYYSAAVMGGLSGQIVSAPRTSSSYVLFVARQATEAVEVERALRAARVDYRRWYGEGIHRETRFLGLASAALPHTEDLARRILGLPMAPDLTSQEIDRVMSAVGDGVRRA